MRPLTTKKDFRLTPLSELLFLITFHSDSNALKELLSNRKPYLVEGRKSDLPSFLREISSHESSRTGRSQDLVDCAYDMTLDKFSHLPYFADPNSTAYTDLVDNPKPRVIDCRNYYKAAHMQFETWRKMHPLAGTIDADLEVCGILCRMVFKHFYWSLKECRRAKMPFARRYVWSFNDEKISLRRPVQIPGADFRKWLEENITDLDPKRPGEAKRIQVEIDEHFTQSHFIPWDEKTVAQIAESSRGANAWATVGGEAETPRLASTVAEEKVANIQTMRPAIRELGKEKLFSLIIRIFNDIGDGIMEDVRIAQDFGLSKATFSRFAGSNWSKQVGEPEATIPDLWLNTGKVLASSPEFMEVALSAGVLPKLKEIARRGRSSNG